MISPIIAFHLRSLRPSAAMTSSSKAMRVTIQPTLMKWQRLCEHSPFISVDPWVTIGSVSIVHRRSSLLECLECVLSRDNIRICEIRMSPLEDYKHTLHRTWDTVRLLISRTQGPRQKPLTVFPLYLPGDGIERPCIADMPGYIETQAKLSGESISSRSSAPGSSDKCFDIPFQAVQ